MCGTNGLLQWSRSFSTTVFRLLICGAVSVLILAARATSDTPQDQLSSIRFVVDLSDLSSRLVGPNNSQVSVLATFSNILNPSDGDHSLAITVTRRPLFVKPSDGAEPIQAEPGVPIKLEKPRLVISYRDMIINIAYAEAMGSERFIIDGTGIATISSIQVPYGQYTIKYGIRSWDNRTQQDSLYYAEERTIMARSARIQDVIISKPTLFESISDTILTPKGGFVTILLSLFAALLASVKKANRERSFVYPRPFRAIWSLVSQQTEV
jgi:hypothetical protein